MRTRLVCAAVFLIACGGDPDTTIEVADVTPDHGSLVGGTSYSDTGLAASTSYSWTVGAVDANGVQGALSTPATGTTLGGGMTPQCFTASNYAHTTAGRAHQSGGYALANGSNQNMGLWNTFVTTTLKQTAANYYVIGTCP